MGWGRHRAGPGPSALFPQSDEGITVSGPKSGHDDGFTLVEVIVALVLLGIVATAALYFFISGMRSTTNLQRQQNAVTVANEAMEMAYAVEPRDSIAVAKTPSIVLGRNQTAVQGAFAAAAALGIEGVPDTYPVWDPTATASSTPTLPLTFTRNHSGMTYNVSLLVGSCFRSASVVNPDQTCTRLAAYTGDPGDAGTPSGMVRMLRITAVVTWEPTSGDCPGGTCSYALSGLIDRSGDLKWNQVIHPVAVDDFEFFDQGESRPIVVLTNDIIGPVSSSPVTLLSSPAAGTAAAGADGKVTYTAPTNASGIYPFTYRIKDARGDQSDPATITVTVPPKSAPDNGNGYVGVPLNLAVTGNDIGTPASVQIVSEPNHGTVSVSGLTVRYTGASPGVDSFVYHYTDASGQVSPNATVTLVVEAFTVQDQIVQVNARGGTTPDEWSSLTVLMIGANPNPSDIRIVVEGATPTSGQLRLGGSVYSTTQTTATSPAVATVEYDPAVNVIGEYSFKYRLQRVSTGVVSDTKTMTIRVVPVAAADAVSTVLQRSGTRDIQISANDRPSVFLGATNTTVQLSSTIKCDGGSAVTFGTHNLAAGVVRVVLPYTKWNRSCSFTYTLVGAGTLSGLTSGPVTVTFSYQ